MAEETQQTQDEGQDVTDNNDEVKEEQTNEAPAESSEAEEAVEETPKEESSTDESEQTEEEEFDLNKWYQERYGAQPSQSEQADDKTFAQRLAELNSDESGTVSPEDAAKAFDDEWNLREQRILERARQEAVASQQESNELRQVLETYPQVKNRKLFDIIANHRDASALRGVDKSLMEAAQEIVELQKEGVQQGTKKARRTQEIQASAHLESSGTKGDSNASELQNLREMAGSSNKTKAAEARRALLRKSIESGDLKISS